MIVAMIVIASLYFGFGILCVYKFWCMEQYDDTPVEIKVLISLLLVFAWFPLFVVSTASD